MKFVRQLCRLFRRRNLEAEMEREMRLHLELQEERNRAAGMEAVEARHAAQRSFGGVEQIKEQCRDQRGWVWLEQTAKDFRFAARSLAKAPGFALAVIATLAVGIGTTTAIVSFAWPVVFPRIPFPEPGQMAVMTNPDGSGAAGAAPYPFFSFPYRLACIREAAASFDGLGAIRQEQANLVVKGDPAAVTLGWVTTDYFAVLDATPACGRLFLPAEYRGRNGETVVLSWGIWEERFGSDPGIVGRDVLLGGRHRRVVGVLARGFTPPPQFALADAYLPETLDPIPAMLPFQWLQVVVRLKPGVAIEQARRELVSLDLPAPPGMGAEFMALLRPRLVPLADYYRGNATIHWVFLGAVAFLYAIACSNAASLVLARTLARRREFGVRLAMGGSRGRIVRLLLAESLILAGIAGGAAVLIAHWGWWALTLQTGAQAAATDRGPANLLLGVTPVVMSLLTSVLVILMPALRIGRVRIGEALKEGAGSLGDSRRLQRIRSGLVVGQAALAVALLTGAGLMLQSFRRLERVGFGFDPAGKLAVMGVLPEAIAPEAYLELAARFRDQLGRVPGVKDVTQSTILPLAHFVSIFPLKIDGRPDLGEIQFSCNRVSREYFDTLGLPLLSGRGFAGLRPGDPPVAIINETAARRYFGPDNPVGRLLDVGPHGKWEIIGVAGDVRERGRRAGVDPQLYCPFWQPPVVTGSLIELVRLEAGSPPGVEAQIRRAAYAVDPRLVVTVRRLSDSARADVARERGAMVVFEVLSTLAVVLAVTGLFAVVTYAVTQRQREFGVRMVLGAAPGALLCLVLRRGLSLALAGVTLGLGAAWALTRFLQSVLFETSPHDPTIYGIVTAGLLVVAAVACWLPARRAAKIDPMVALRCE